MSLKIAHNKGNDRKKINLQDFVFCPAVRSLPPLVGHSIDCYARSLHAIVVHRQLRLLGPGNFEVSYSFTFCDLAKDMVTTVRYILATAAAITLSICATSGTPAPAPPCKTDFDCSLNGHCESSGECRLWP